MKVELLVNLKIASGKIISAGTIFSDEFEPIPEFVMKRIVRKTARIIDSRPTVPSEVKQPASEIPAEEKEAEVEAEKEAEKEANKPVPKKVVKKKINK